MNQSTSIPQSSNVQSLAPIKARSFEDAGRFTAVGGNRKDEEVANFLNDVFEFSVSSKISDVHFEFDDILGLKVRLRSSGDLSPYEKQLTPELARIVKTKLCAKAKLDDQQRLIPQDGRMTLFFCGRRVDIRLNIVPSVAGYKCVCRLLDSDNSNADLDNLDMPFIVKQTLRRCVSAKQGLMLMSGETGSGKTTTLYALLKYLKSPKKHILTAEHPVEYSDPEITQIDVNNVHMTFQGALKAALRQDIDVMMVGEMRDAESAGIAVEACGTGHFILSTVHANDSIYTMERLKEIGLEPYKFVGFLKAVAAQRLVKRIVPDAQISWVEPNQVEMEWLITHNAYINGMKIPKVNEKDLKGRIAIIELIEVTRKIKEIIINLGKDNLWQSKVAKAAAMQPQFETLAQAGVRLVIDGKTTLAEVMKEATAESGNVSSAIRFDQVLLRDQLIKSDVMEKIHKEIFAKREEGFVVTVEDLLVAGGYCTKQDVDRAKEISNASIA